MTFDLPTQFPGVVETPLVTRLQFPNSGVTIEGHFRLNEFTLLPATELEFLRLYVKVRGNLKEVERVMGLSYPTIRSRFEDVLQALGYEAEQNDEDARDDVIGALERGEISADVALDRLKRI